jgi:alpha-galactosidase
MKKTVTFIICFVVAALVGRAAEKPLIHIATDNISVVYRVGDDGRLYQSYVGRRLHHESDLRHLLRGVEACISHGMEDYFEPAIDVLHNDGASSLLLKYVSHSVKTLSDGVVETGIMLADRVYPVTVRLTVTAYTKEDIVKMSVELSHREKRPLVVRKIASSMLHFNRSSYTLTQFTGDWAQEAQMSDLPLTTGKKVLDSKLGSRANMFVSPFFHVSFDGQSTEQSGETLTGTLGWTGNFRFTFEVDSDRRLRIISGINPYNSEYELPQDEVFRTPDFYFTFTGKGRGQASRNFHDWARRHQLKDGLLPRMTLLNNWEATGFNFDENRLVSLMGEAAELGVDMFLLDDGWFGNKYPRKDDSQGLGDWTATADKLPGGIARLTQAADSVGVRFGIWIEPEMVNPKSELAEQHPDWILRWTNRDVYYFRNQLVLDLSNPKVQDCVFGVVDELMSRYPDIAYMKWDCNSPITNIWSPWLKTRQSRLYIEYVRGLYSVLDRIAAKYPALPMMLCSGGGGRTDYEALRYFTEFWASDNTDPVERLFIQWGYSQLFPAKAVCAHVTSWNRNASIKFRTDVAMMCKLGFDLRLADLSSDEKAFCRNAVTAWKRLSPAVLDGDLYRLVSPYDGEHTASLYLSKDGRQAAVFAFDLNPRYVEKRQPVKLQGLSPDRMYRIREINLLPGQRSSLRGNEQIFSGEYLTTVGLYLFSAQKLSSRVVEITEEQE